MGELTVIVIKFVRAMLALGAFASLAGHSDRISFTVNNNGTITVISYDVRFPYTGENKIMVNGVELSISFPKHRGAPAILFTVALLDCFVNFVFLFVYISLVFAPGTFLLFVWHFYSLSPVVDSFFSRFVEFLWEIRFICRTVVPMAYYSMVVLDYILSGCAAFLWSIFSITWAIILLQMEKEMTPDNFLRINQELCEEPIKCESGQEYNFGGLRLSVVLAFLSALFSFLNFRYIAQSI